MKITAVLPCRAGSVRVPRKNVRPFAETSLLEIKLNQLLSVDCLDKIIVSTDDPEVIDICAANADDRLVIETREDYFASSECSTDELIKYFIENLEFEHLLWTHVTSPFFNKASYDRAIKTYRETLDKGYDSLMSVSPCQTFVWSKEGAVNYDRSSRKWPFTQDIEPLYLVNSAVFIAPRTVMQSEDDRIGQTPYLFETQELESFDIDWEHEYKQGEKLWRCFKDGR